ncbi:ATP-binding protein [Devosia sp. ZW T5_3]|uniref:ATP-binding protein n=1 Tax=Devosia sp. ZW T5_3 TaxID=3378085 RepID=UPI0038538D5D
MAHDAAAQRQLLVTTRLVSPVLLQCSVEDSGPGIPEPNLPRLFDTFYTTKDNGMGMGLPICRSIVEAHGGQISADNNSTLGGARFSFTLPIGERTPD